MFRTRGGKTLQIVYHEEAKNRKLFLSILKKIVQLNIKHLLNNLKHVFGFQKKILKKNNLKNYTEKYSLTKSRNV